MKILKKLSRQVVARVLLGCLVFGIVGVAVPVMFGEPVVASAAATATPTPENVDDAMSNIENAVSTKLATDNAVGDIANGVRPEDNVVVRAVTNPVNKGLNTVMYIALLLINTYFFVQTCFDVGFLTAPAFRETLSGRQDSDGMDGKAARFANGMISEAALNAVGYRKSSDNKKHLECEEPASEVNWKSWLTKRLVMFVSIMTYMALLFLGLVPELVNVMTKIGYTIVQSLLHLFK